MTVSGEVFKLHLRMGCGISKSRSTRGNYHTLLYIVDSLCTLISRWVQVLVLVAYFNKTC